MPYITYIEEKNGRIPLHFLDAACINGYFWVNALEWNGYYKVNIETGRGEFLGTFENEDLMANKLFNQVLAYERYVFFIPWFSNYLVKLNTQNLETAYYKLPNSIIKEIAKFRVAAIYEKRIFMFPHISDAIYIFDIETEKFLCDKGWAEEITQFGTLHVKDRFVQGCRIEEQIYLASFSGSFFMKYNFKNYQYEMVVLPEAEKKIVDITVFGKDKLIILTWAGNVWSYDIQNGCKELIYKYGGNIEFPYRHALLLQHDNFLLIPAFEEKIVLVDKDEENLLLYPNEWKKQSINVGIESMFNGYYRRDNVIILYPCLGNMLLKIDINKPMLIGVETTVESNMNLSSFLNMVDRKEDKENAYRNNIHIKGMQIWNKVGGN